MKQININKSYTKTSSLLNYCENKKIDLIMLQEPNIKGGVVCGFLQSHRKVYIGTSPKAATIVLNKDIKVLNLKEYNHEYIVAIEIKDFKGNNYVLINVYMPLERHKEKFTELMKQINKIIRKLKDENKQFLIAGDINSKHVQWGNLANDKRSKEWFKLISKNEIVILNEGQTPTYESPRGNSCIDITLAEERIYEKIKKWKIERDNAINSDHNPITFEIETEEETEDNISRRYNMKKSNLKEIIKKAKTET